MAKVSFEKVTKIYSNGFQALHGIDLNISDGEFMVIVGPSGCSKSTTLRMLAGLESVTGGQIKIGDKIVNNLAPKERGIAMVFQNYALYPHMTVRQNLGFGLKLARKSKAEIRRLVEEAAELLEISSLLDRLPRQLSGGQAQRVAVGRAIVKHPSVFLFDEPLSNLDAKLRASMRLRISDLHKQLKASNQSATTVYVTHDQTEAMTMGDRICVMKAGYIMQVDTPNNLYKYPKNLFVAGFIGAPVMNMIESSIVQTQNNQFKIKFSNEIIDLGPKKSSQLDAKDQQRVILGIRPEHVQFADPECPGEQVVKGKIIRLENMGPEFYVYFEVGPDQLCARVPSAVVEEKMSNAVGKTVDFYFEMDNCHIFHKETEQNLSL